MTGNTRRIRADVTLIEYVRTSQSGNPTYRLYAGNGDAWLTETDAAVGYSVMNYQPRGDDESADLWLELNTSGRVVAVERT